MTSGRDLPGRMDTLERLLAPRREQFVREHWGRSPLLLSRTERDGDFDDLFSPDAVDELLTGRGLRTPFLRMAQAGRTLAEREFTTGGGVGAGIADQLDGDAIRRRFADGATIVLQGLHRTLPPLETLAASLAAELGHPVQVNAYVTPPGNQGFAAHYDVHDVFVLQIHGAKAWRVHDPVWPDPLRDQPWEDRRGLVVEAAHAEPVLEAELRPGDLLYLPRGFLHSATASDGVSIHLTIGIHTWTRNHLVEAMLDHLRRTLAEDPALRGSLPVGVDVADPMHLAADADAVRAALVHAVRSVSDESLAQSLCARARAGQRPIAVPVLAQIAAAERLEAGDFIALRPHVMASLETDDTDRIVVRSRAGRSPVPPAAGVALRRLLDGERVQVADLLPGDAEAARILGRRLMVDGIALVGDRVEGLSLAGREEP